MPLRLELDSLSPLQGFPPPPDPREAISRMFSAEQLEKMKPGDFRSVEKHADGSFTLTSRSTDGTMELRS